MTKNDLLGQRKITRTSRGQLPKNYIAGTSKMQRHPFSVGRSASSPDPHAGHGKKKAKK